MNPNAASTSALTNTEEIWKQYHLDVNDNFTSSGKFDQIVDTAVKTLNNSPWADEVQRRMDELVRHKMWNKSALTDEQIEEARSELRDELRRSIPSDVKQSVMAFVTDYVDDQMRAVKRDFQTQSPLNNR